MADAFGRLLRGMLEEGRVAWSGVSTRSRKKLQSLFDAGVLRRVRRGGGFVIEVRDEDVLRGFYRKHYPKADLPADVPPRARALGSLRSAKRVGRTDREPVLLRAFQPADCKDNGTTIDLREATRQTGAACLILGETHFWSISAEVAVVENLECFLHFEKMQVGAEVALYASGRLSNLVLRWLGSAAMEGSRFVHCGDYDPVGLDEYLRLKALAGDRARLHVPRNLPELLRTMGRPELLRDSAPAFQRLRGSDDPDIQRVVRILDRTGCGLEQEALLIGLSGSHATG